MPQEDEPCHDGVEKSEFEANEKTASFHEDIATEDTVYIQAPDESVFCAHASFVAQLNDGMVVTCSGFGTEGKHGKQGAGADKEAASGDSSSCV